MSKLINLIIQKAKGIICVTKGPRPNELDYFIPKWYVIGIFDDGSVRGEGIENLVDVESVDFSPEGPVAVSVVSKRVADSMVRFLMNGKAMAEVDAYTEVIDILEEANTDYDEGVRNYLYENSTYIK